MARLVNALSRRIRAYRRRQMSGGGAPVNRVMWSTNPGTWSGNVAKWTS